ncbi:DNA/RNA non-specific endonuclease [Streptomyces sp. NPDC055059]
MNSCLDAAYVDTHEGTPAVGERATGYQWAKDTVNAWGYEDDSRWINACHLLSRELSGSGRDGANLSTCTRPANAMVRGTDRIEKNFRYYEKQVRNAVKQGQVVQYSVEPNYTGGRVVASSWTFNARAWDGNGNPHVLFSGGTVRNELGGKNLGEQFTKKGTPVPLPGS